MAGKLLVPSAERSRNLGSEWVLAALRQLDALLEKAVVAMQRDNPKESRADISLPGLCIQPAEIERLLARPPSAPFWCNEKEACSTKVLPDAMPLLCLQHIFGLSTFDLCLPAL
jgi:hypothetical protein